MRIASQRYRPGIPSPRGAALAVGVMAVMGLYGFTTSLQKTVAVHRSNVAAASRSNDDVRLASAVGPTPSLVYAVTDRPLAVAQAPRKAPPRLAPPVIAPEPVPVELAVVSAPAPAAAGPAEAPQVVPDAGGAAVDASAALPAADAPPRP